MTDAEAGFAVFVEGFIVGFEVEAMADFAFAATAILDFDVFANVFAGFEATFEIAVGFFADFGLVLTERFELTPSSMDLSSRAMAFGHNPFWFSQESGGQIANNSSAFGPHTFIDHFTST